MKNLNSLFLSAAILLLASDSWAHPEALAGDRGLEHSAISGTGQLAFEENKGQVRTTEGKPAPYVRYQMVQGNTHIFLLENGIAFQFNRVHMEAPGEDKSDLTPVLTEQIVPSTTRLETYRMDMLLEGANAYPRISTEGRSEDQTHYYNVPEGPALDVHSFTRVTYHDVWPGIDWVIYATTNGMKYDFLVHPGADPGRVNLRFKDHEELRVDADGRLIHGNRMGQFTEERPVSFQNGTEIPTRFSLDGDLLGFSVGAYDKTRTLTIDPDRIWGTYYGGEAFDAFNNCETDTEGNVIVAGQTSSTAGIANSGHQLVHGGDSDSFLAKFNGDGVRIWATYFGGPGYEAPTGTALYDNGAIYLSGFTSSTSGIASDGHQTTYGGGLYDAFLAKFTAAGLLQWGTYYGGAPEDKGHNCAVDPDGNVYLVGVTPLNSGIHTGWLQAAYGGGITDGFVAKFGPDGVRQWGSYYGGDGEDIVRDCAVDADGNIHLVGSTYSTTGIAENGHQNAFGGGGNLWDGFVAKIDANGVRIWGTYYGGPTGDELLRLALDQDDVYVCGAVSATTNMSAGGHQNTYGGGVYDAILIKFAPDGTRTWATYYGGTDFDLGYHLAIDSTTTPHTVYMSGWSASTNAIASNGYQNVNAGGPSDAYIAKFNLDGNRLWATYYGGSLSDQGAACAVSPEGFVYLLGNTSSTSSIAENGFQNTYGGGNYDAYIVKLDGSFTGIDGPSDHAVAVIWPNPASNELWIGTGEEINKPTRLVVRDMTGRVVMDHGRANPSRPGIFRADIGQLASGPYSVEVLVGDRRWSARFLKE
ncbi:MAG: hypothetical protein IPO87_15350 [Flavobacteriales bacterium]|nr:hypothetical protein [Flavobacteriales bacterium]